MLDEKEEVQGVAVYAEFEKVGQAFQLLLTPDAYNKAGKLIPMAIHRRTVTKETPKKQWKSSKMNTEKVEKILATSGAYVNSSEVSNFTEERLRMTLPIFDQLLTSGWAIRNRPILVQFSKYDAEDVDAGKTPNKVLYRVQLCRLALGLSKDVI